MLARSARRVVRLLRGAPGATARRKPCLACGGRVPVLEVPADDGATHLHCQQCGRLLVIERELSDDERAALRQLGEGGY